MALSAVRAYWRDGPFPGSPTMKDLKLLKRTRTEDMKAQLKRAKDRIAGMKTQLKRANTKINKMEAKIEHLDLELSIRDILLARHEGAKKELEERLVTLTSGTKSLKLQYEGVVQHNSRLLDQLRAAKKTAKRKSAETPGRVKRPRTDSAPEIILLSE